MTAKDHAPLGEQNHYFASGLLPSTCADSIIFARQLINKRSDAGAQQIKLLEDLLSIRLDATAVWVPALPDPVVSLFLVCCEALENC